MPASKRKRKQCKDSAPESDHFDNESDANVRKTVRWEAQGEQDQDDREQSTSDTEDNSVAPDKVYLAAFSQHNRIGCAYYDPIKCVLFVLEDTQETPQFDLTYMLLEQASPDLVLTSSKSDDDFIDAVRSRLDEVGGHCQIRPHKEFVAAKGRDRLLSLHLLTELPSEEVEEHLESSPTARTGVQQNVCNLMRKRRETSGDPTTMRWNALIRLSNFTAVETSPLCMASVGALIDHLVRERALGDLADDGIRGLDIRDIEALCLNQVMQINADALFSLQVFENESHASVHSDKTKEGLSLFGILNNTRTALGRSLLRTWFLRPSLSLSVIQARHDAVACFTSPENTVTVTSMHNHLKGVKNVPRILGVMRTGKARLADWQGLVKFTFYAAMLRETIIELHQAGDVDIVQRLVAALDIAIFREVGAKINEIIDWEESSLTGRVCVRPHVDEELDNKKHVYHGIDSVLSNVAEQIYDKLPEDYTTSLNVVYFPQLGYLICIPMQESWQTEGGFKMMDDWSFQFSSNEYVYFKSPEMHDLDVHIGDLHSLIVDREIEIIQELLDSILVHDKTMVRACDVCAELDCLLSFAEASCTYGYRRPEMVEDNIIQIVEGRHPLQEQMVDTFVPNDIRVVGGDFNTRGSPPTGWNSIVLCTGPNACGKSVYLKQTALIQFMAQIGWLVNAAIITPILYLSSFVPAESAILGLVDKIFTRLSTRESVSKVQSAFMIDLNQVSLALRNSTPRSLILLDEFGKGTLSTDGAGLFCGVLQHLLSRGTQCPKVLVATHFHDVFRADILDPLSLPITFCHMQVMFTTGDGRVIDTTDTDSSSGSKLRSGDRITYLYRVSDGLVLESHAAKCAEIFGIPPRLVERAQYVSDLITQHEVIQLLDEEMMEHERNDLEDAEAVCRRFLQWDLQNYSEGVGVKSKLREVLGRAEESETPGVITHKH